MTWTNSLARASAEATFSPLPILDRGIERGMMTPAPPMRIDGNIAVYLDFFEWR